jgi:hypothetical protein
MKSVDEMLGRLEGIARVAIRNNDAKTAQKATEAQLKYILELRKTNPLDLNLLTADELQALIDNMMKSLNVTADMVNPHAQRLMKEMEKT